jgi:GrpB-like predicted nucleotidyltransferase (UPF0157 family)
MDAADDKATLQRYLQVGREALVWKLDGLSEYDVRRPLVRTGTNLLGLVKHLAGVEAGYLGEVFDRPFAEPLPWMAEDAEPNADLWATVEESRDDIVGLYRRVWAHTDTVIGSLALDATGRVPWWPPDRREVTLQVVLVHLIAETHRHAGHADIVRELVDGTAGLRADDDNLPSADDAWWAAHRERVDAVARQASDQPDRGWPAWAREPITIVDPDPAWPRLARALADDVAERLAPFGMGPVEHVGSTAVPGLPAKPVLDLQAPVRSLDDAEAAAATLATTGWQLVPPDLDDRAWRRFYVLPDGARRWAHLSLVDAGHPRAQEVVRFRDLLRARPDLARIYAEVKRLAAAAHEHDREAYTAAKGEVIRALLEAGGSA